jgi:hypothetical protein
MKILTKIWKKLLNEAGIPVLHMIDEQRENFIPIWKIDETPQIKQPIRSPSECFDANSLLIE